MAGPYPTPVKEGGGAASTCLDRVTRLRCCGLILGHRPRLDPAKLGRGLEALLCVQVRPYRGHLVVPFVERVQAGEESWTVFHAPGPDDCPLHVAVASIADPQHRPLLPPRADPVAP